MKKKKINYKSLATIILAIAVGIFFGNKLAYYQMYRVEINHEKNLSITLSAANDEETPEALQLSEDQSAKEDEWDASAETTITTFPAVKENEADTDSVANPDSAANSSAAENPGLININTADIKTLDTLPGIGEVKAQAIIDYRNKYGNFLSTEEIMNVYGIGEKTYEDLKDLICV